jgi:hypothetical protein
MELSEGTIPLSPRETAAVKELGNVTGYTRREDGKLVITLVDGTEKVI